MEKYNIFINKYFDYSIYVPTVEDKKKQEIYDSIITKLNFSEDDLRKVGDIVVVEIMIV